MDAITNRLAAALEPFALAVAAADTAWRDRGQGWLDHAGDCLKPEDYQEAKDALAALEGVGVSALKRIGKAAILQLAAIEAHCRNDAGLKGNDHAYDGERVRRGVQLFLADPEVQAIVGSDAIAEGLDLPIRVPLPKPIAEAATQLRDHQQQADMDGSKVTVSREALDIVLGHITSEGSAADV